MPRINHNLTPAQKRKSRVRGKLMGTAERPRLSVFRSNKNIYLQVIDDEAMKTLAAANDLSLKKSGEKLAGTKSEKAVLVTKDLIKKMKNKKVGAVKFDRGSHRYHGRLKVVAEELRSAGIKV
jgi:large subunit ribosomal protein L18